LKIPLRSRRDLPHLALKQFHLIRWPEVYAILFKGRQAAAPLEGAHIGVPGEWRQDANPDVGIFEESCLL
jgi:hypothetical protein